MTLPSAIVAHNAVGAHSAAEPPLLAVRDLSVTFPKRYGPVAVLDGIHLTVHKGQAVAVVGESGCGKSLLGLAAANLLPGTAQWSGAISFRGNDIRTMTKRQQREVRGQGVGVIYQDAMTSLNPGMTIGAQLRQVCRLGSSSTPQDLLVSVGLNDTERIMRSRPYHLSGGQRQRVLIAIALARDPDLVIADEPTTALDVTIQRQIVELLMELRRRRQFALIFISHDLGLVSEITTHTTVLYAGQVVEAGPTQQILSEPHHPYTAGLLRASRSLEERWPVLAPIPGYVTQPADFPTGCRFRDRCSYADDACATKPAIEGDEDRALACYHPLYSNNSSRSSPYTEPDSTGPNLAVEVGIV